MSSDSITLDEATHTYRIMGDVVPSVTQILRPIMNMDSIPKHVLEAKADLGRRVHLACQFDDEGDLYEGSIEDDVAPYLAGWRRFRRDTECEIVANEKIVFEPMHRYAGTLDRVLRFDMAFWLIDIKSSFRTPASAGAQTAAYMRALCDTRVSRRAAVRLTDDGKYRLEPLNGTEDWATFLACLTVHRFRERHYE